MTDRRDRRVEEADSALLRPDLYPGRMAASTVCAYWKVQPRFAMSRSATNTHHAHLETAIALARILERVERGAQRIDADQYQLLVARLKAALAQNLPEAALDAVLGALPAAAELYENMHYPLSGLSRSPLERSVASELLTAKLLARVSKASKAAWPGPA